MNDLGDIRHDLSLLDAKVQAAKIEKMLKQNKQFRIPGVHLDAKAGLVDVSANGKHLVKTFLLNDKRNKNKWRVSWESIKKYARDFIGMPGIGYTKCEMGKCDLDHTGGSTYESAIQEQSHFAVSKIIDVTFNDVDKTADAIHEITDKKFGDKIRAGRIKYVSPAVWPDREHTAVGDLDELGLRLIDSTKWRPLHVAFVNNPAFGMVADVRGQCDGGTECLTKLLSAKSIEPMAQLPMMIMHHGVPHMVNASERIQQFVTQKISDGARITDNVLTTAFKSTSEVPLVASCGPCKYSRMLADFRHRIAKLE